MTKTQRDVAYEWFDSRVKAFKAFRNRLGTSMDAWGPIKRDKLDTFNAMIRISEQFEELDAMRWPYVPYGTPDEESRSRELQFLAIELAARNEDDVVMYMSPGRTVTAELVNGKLVFTRLANPGMEKRINVIVVADAGSNEEAAHALVTQNNQGGDRRSIFAVAVSEEPPVVVEKEPEPSIVERAPEPKKKEPETPVFKKKDPEPTHDHYTRSRPAPASSKSRRAPASQTSKRAAPKSRDELPPMPEQIWQVEQSRFKVGASRLGDAASLKTVWRRRATASLKKFQEIVNHPQLPLTRGYYERVQYISTMLLHNSVYVRYVTNLPRTEHVHSDAVKLVMLQLASYGKQMLYVTQEQRVTVILNAEKTAIEVAGMLSDLSRQVLQDEEIIQVVDAGRGKFESLRFEIMQEPRMLVASTAETPEPGFERFTLIDIDTSNLVLAVGDDE